MGPSFCFSMWKGHSWHYRRAVLNFSKVSLLNILNMSGLYFHFEARKKYSRTILASLVLCDNPKSLGQNNFTSSKLKNFEQKTFSAFFLTQRIIGIMSAYFLHFCSFAQDLSASFFLVFHTLGYGSENLTQLCRYCRDFSLVPRWAQKIGWAKMTMSGYVPYIWRLPALVEWGSCWMVRRDDEELCCRDILRADAAWPCAATWWAIKGMWVWAQDFLAPRVEGTRLDHYSYVPRTVKPRRVQALPLKAGQSGIS